MLQEPEGRNRIPQTQSLKDTAVRLFTTPAIEATRYAMALNFPLTNNRGYPWARLSQYEKQGMALLHSNVRDEQRYAPEVGSALERQILFLGHENYEGLRTFVHDKVKKLSAFEFRDFFGNDTVGIGEERISRLLLGMDFVENAYGTRIRNTGERGFAHPLRVISDGIDFLYDCVLIDKTWKERQDKIPFHFEKWTKPNYFTPENIEIFLWTLLLHDFTERDSKRYEDDSKKDKIPIGKLRFDGINPANDSFEMILTSNANPKYNVSEQEASIPINWDHSTVPMVIAALKSLDSSDVPDSEAVKKIIEDSLRRNQEVVGMNQFFILNLLPHIAKALDRKDNVRSRSFINTWLMENGSYKRVRVPAPYTEFRDKVQETIRDYPDLERLVWFAMTRMYNNLTIQFFKGLFPEVLQHLPTVFAQQVLQGKYPDEIFRTADDPSYRGSPRWV